MKYMHKNEQAGYEEELKRWEATKPPEPRAYTAQEAKKTRTVDTPDGEAIAQEGDFVLTHNKQSIVVHADDLEHNWIKLED